MQRKEAEEAGARRGEEAEAKRQRKEAERRKGMDEAEKRRAKKAEAKRRAFLGNSHTVLITIRFESSSFRLLAVTRCIQARVGGKSTNYAPESAKKARVTSPQGE